MKSKIMLNLIKIVLLIALMMNFTPALHTLANDGVLGITPEGVYPVTQSDIAMESEEIIIKMVGYSEAEVSCRFDFKNYGDAQTVLIGFPARLDEEVTELSPEEAITVREFTARDENGDLTVNLVDTIPNPPLSDVSHMAKYAKWYSFSVDFKKNGTKTLYHTYKVSFPHNSIGDIFAGYVLETGALWKGTIDHSTVVFDLGEHPIYSVTEVYPNNFFRIEGNKLIFERKNFKPSYNLWVTVNGYHYSNDWIDMLKDSGQTGEIDMINNRIAFFAVKPEEIRKNSNIYLKQYNELIKEDQLKALYIKSALGLPDGSEKPEIVDCVITQRLQGDWWFDVYGTDPDMDIVSSDAEINGMEEYMYNHDSGFQHGSILYDREKKWFRGRGLLKTSENKPFSITFRITDAQGNMDTETLILNTETNESDSTMPEPNPAQSSPSPAAEAFDINVSTASATGANEINANSTPDADESIPSGGSDEGAKNNSFRAGKLIHTEEETVPMLIAGAVTVLAAFLVVVIVLLLKRRNRVYLLFIGQIACLAMGLYQVASLLSIRDHGDGMASENISLGIGLTAVFWAFSMAFMVCGIILTGKKQHTGQYDK